MNFWVTEPYMCESCVSELVQLKLMKHGCKGSSAWTDKEEWFILLSTLVPTRIIFSMDRLAFLSVFSSGRHAHSPSTALKWMHFKLWAESCLGCNVTVIRQREVGVTLRTSGNLRILQALIGFMRGNIIKREMLDLLCWVIIHAFYLIVIDTMQAIYDFILLGENIKKISTRCLAIGLWMTHGVGCPIYIWWIWNARLVLNGDIFRLESNAL